MRPLGVAIESEQMTQRKLLLGYLKANNTEDVREFTITVGTTDLASPMIWRALDTYVPATVPFSFSILTANPGGNFYRVKLGP